jgi:hypothetical protein
MVSCEHVTAIARLPEERKATASMRAPIPAEDREIRASRVVAEALVRRQGPLRIAARATRIGISPILTRAMIVACGATSLDSDGASHRQPAEACSA